MTRIVLMIVLLLAFGPVAAQAEDYLIIDDRAQFERLVQGKILTVKTPFYVRNSIRLVVRPSGTIQGRALRSDVTGSWNWDQGFFCREIDWDGTEIPYNCQQVLFNGTRLRFVSDRGTGAKADFSLDTPRN